MANQTSEIPHPPLTINQRNQIREYPTPSNVLREMRADMAARGAAAGSALSDREVISKILQVGLYEAGAQDGSPESNVAVVARESVSSGAAAVRDFVRTVLSFLSTTNAAAALEFNVYAPEPPVPGQKQLGPVDTEHEELDPNSTTPPTLFFSDALGLIIPLWPNLRPPPSSESGTEAAEDLSLQEASVLPLTVELFYQIMGQDHPLGYENDVEIWQAVQNLLHLFLSPTVTATAEPGTYSRFQQRLSKQFVSLTKRLNTYAKEHPYKFGGQVALGVVTTFPGLILTPLLGLIGFGAAGVAGGSSAALWQSAAYAGKVPAGSLFSLCQSYAMGGTVLVSKVRAVSAAAVGVSRLLGWTGNNNPGDPSSEEPGTNKSEKGEERK